MASEAIAVRAEGAASRPYPPGWLDLIIAWVHGRPWPAWLTYLGLIALGILVSNAQNWLSGAPLGSFTLVQTAWGVVTVGSLTIIDFLNRVAGDAFDRFRPAISPGRIDEARIRYELTTESRGLSLVIVAVSVPLTVVYYVSDPVGSQVAGLSPVALIGRTVFESFFSAVLLILVVHAVRQLRLVSHLHDQADRLDPFRPGPLHAFSRLTALTGGSLVAVIVIGIVLNPDSIASDAALTLWLPWVVGFPVAGALIFIVPLLGMHGRLAAAKADLQGASEERLKSVLAALHADVDALDLARADSLQKTLGSLIQEREILARLPTWPWSAGTARGFASALLLPLAVFLLQRALIALLPA